MKLNYYIPCINCGFGFKAWMICLEMNEFLTFGDNVVERQ